ncbi:MAG: histidine phosphatase family protein [Chloroflexi bacterium]|nr:histidine phosphatase family protein [Chloroflexota bacterium]MCI0577925.1 histidine phosphatase family protein [Chloroflexota bacterium]MCI0645805.1 histidine phosphatase family protein [Chloroflexota bacterium]MCI0727274.1 histidine phosphatase family protein [Chloroflexota bacterium]
MHLYLIRHGQSHVNLTEWASGNTDEGLTELGKRQAAALAGWLPHHVPIANAIYASTMRRARETAAPLAAAYRVAIRYDDRLREIGNNRLDHTPWPNDDLPREYAEYWASERPFSPVTPIIEGGETFIHFRARVGLLIEELVERHRDGVVLAICHGGVIEAAFDHIFNVGPWRRCEIWNHNTGVTYFEYVAHPRRETWRLHYNNYICHLQEELV